MEQLVGATDAERIEHYSMPVPESGCWLWIGAIDYRGYGRTVGETRNKWRLAHRVSWAVRNGPIPDGLCICHKCDTPSCVNPDHLFAGTPSQNQQDSVAKGRNGGWVQRGEKHASAKVNATQALEIFSASGSNREIADMFKTTYWIVYGIRHGLTWAHLTGAK